MNQIAFRRVRSELLLNLNAPCLRRPLTSRATSSFFQTFFEVLRIGRHQRESIHDLGTATCRRSESRHLHSSTAHCGQGVQHLLQSGYLSGTLKLWTCAGWENFRIFGSKFRQTCLALLEVQQQLSTNLVVFGEALLYPLHELVDCAACLTPFSISCKTWSSVPSCSTNAAMAASSLEALDFAASAMTSGLE